MFSIRKTKPAKSSISDQVIDMAPVEVHIPPARFLPEDGGSSSSNKKSGRKITIILIVIFIVLLVGGAGVWFYFKNKAVDDPVTDIDIAPIDINDNTDIQIDDDDVIDDPITVPPPLITYISKDPTGAVNGIVTLQLSAADKSLLNEISIIGEATNSDNQHILGNAYKISPGGTTLEEIATLTIEYFDTSLSSNLENSLRMAFLNSSAIWQLDEDSVIDLNRNQVSLEIIQLPSTFVAVVSNLTQDEIDPDLPIEDPVEEFELQNLKPSFDADDDGLSDIEELLLGTDIDMPDTDLDGYTDGDELKKLYSPTEAGKTLLETQQFTTYTNPAFGYSLQHPNSWVANSIDPSSNVIIFSSATNQFVEVLVEYLDMDVGTIQDWYKSQVPGLSDEDIRITSVGPDNYFAILSVDGSTVYFMIDRLVIGISYNKGIEEEVDYFAIWEAMKYSWSFPESDNTIEFVQPVDELDIVEDVVEPVEEVIPEEVTEPEEVPVTEPEEII